MSRVDADSQNTPSTIDSLIDVNDGYAVLAFTYNYLIAHALAPTDDEVRAVTAALARYKGARMATVDALEAFLGEQLGSAARI
jgi:hypothetical protein